MTVSQPIRQGVIGLLSTHYRRQSIWGLAVSLATRPWKQFAYLFAPTSISVCVKLFEPPSVITTTMLRRPGRSPFSGRNIVSRASRSASAVFVVPCVYCTSATARRSAARLECADRCHSTCEQTRTVTSSATSSVTIQAPPGGTPPAIRVPSSVTSSMASSLASLFASSVMSPAMSPAMSSVMSSLVSSVISSVKSQRALDQN